MKTISARACSFFMLALLLVSCRMGVQLNPTDTPIPKPATPSATSSPAVPSSSTNTATQVPPTLTFTPTLRPFRVISITPTPLPGWKTYTNDYLGYSIHYPSQVEVIERGAVGMDTNEIVPPGFTYWEYFDYVQAILPKKLCVSFEIPGVSITIAPPYDSLGSYIGPCPGMGIGSQYIMEGSHETLWIAGQQYQDSQGAKLYLKSTGAFDFEFYAFNLENGFSVRWSGGPQVEISYESYLAQRSIALEIIASLHWFRIPDLTKPGTTCAGRFTRLMPGVEAVAVGESGDLPNQVRSGPNIADDVIYQIEPRSVVKTIAGPVCADGLVFWEIENASIPGGSGWMAEGDGIEYWLEPYQP